MKKFRCPHFEKIGTDSITGFTGTVTGFAQYITGCDQYLLTPKCKEGDNGTLLISTWFDENRVVLSDGVLNKAIPPR